MTLTLALADIRGWHELRSPSFEAHASAVIGSALPLGLQIASVSHLRTAHYAVYRVAATDGSALVVRVGAVSEGDDAPASNTGYQGTALAPPTGQRREMDIALGFAAAGARVAAPVHYARTETFDVLWVPFLTGSGQPLTDGQWHAALTGLHSYRPEEELPVFTNRAKSFARLDELPDHLTVALRNRYDTRMEALFEAATSWSVVHGDAHAGNALNVGGNAVLFDFDTACWAPSVWDLTHLLNRAGTGENTGYTAKLLASLFPFTAAELSAALELRKVAAEIARVHRSHATPSATPGAVRSAA